MNGVTQEINSNPHFADAQPQTINGQKVYTSKTAGGSTIYSDGKPIIVDDYNNFLKNMNAFACGNIEGKKLEYKIDENCDNDLNLNECSKRGWTCFLTKTTVNNESKKICCTWK